MSWRCREELGQLILVSPTCQISMSLPYQSGCHSHLYSRGSWLAHSVFYACLLPLQAAKPYPNPFSSSSSIGGSSHGRSPPTSISLCSSSSSSRSKRWAPAAAISCCSTISSSSTATTSASRSSSSGSRGGSVVVGGRHVSPMLLPVRRAGQHTRQHQVRAVVKSI